MPSAQLTRLVLLAVAAAGTQVAEAGQASALFTVSATLGAGPGSGSCRFIPLAGVVECRTPDPVQPLPGHWNETLPADLAGPPVPVPPQPAPVASPAPLLLPAPPPSAPVSQSDARPVPPGVPVVQRASGAYWPWQTILRGCRVSDDFLEWREDVPCQVVDNGALGASSTTRFVRFGGREYLEMTLSW